MYRWHPRLRVLVLAGAEPPLRRVVLRLLPADFGFSRARGAFSIDHFCAIAMNPKEADDGLADEVIDGLTISRPSALRGHR